MPRLATACLALFLLAGRAAAAEESYLRYKVEIEAPKRLAGVLRAALDLVRWEGYETMTPELLERLVREARAEAAEILAAHGYFSPVVEARIEGEGAMRVVRIEVQPGAPTRVRKVDFVVTGPMARGDAIDREARVRAESEWKLAVGETFTQAGWDQAKRAALESVSLRRYLTARISESEARIDPASQAAELRVTIESGPAIAFGELEVAGLDKYDPALVRNLWTFAPGADYDRELLERFQRRVTALEYFDSVLVDADPTHIAGGRVPVRVTLHEAPEKRIQLGANFSTDSGLGGSVAYQNRNFLNRAWRLGTRLDLQQKLQTADATIGLP
jgi:translocation and assembly module TamA